jgi:histidyl-tRNA synthetase
VAVIVGAEGCPEGLVRLRDMTSGQERDLTVDELLKA